MAKIFDRPDSEIGKGIIRINEDKWFAIEQNLLLKLANTDYGKDLLCIPKEYKNIFKIGKNHIFHNPRMEKGKLHYDWDFRVGAKWANVIRYRWSAFQEAALYFQERNTMAPVVLAGNAYAYAFGGPYYPDPDPETTTVDGYVARASAGDETWANNRTGAGDLNSSTATGGQSVNMRCGGGANTWDQRIRSIYLFDTSAIPDGDTISVATLSIYGTATDNDAHDQNATIVIATPGSNTTLANSDYNIANWTMTQQNSSDIDYGAWNTAGYNDFGLSATGIGNILKTGVSKFGMTSSGDRTNTEPTFSAGTDSGVNGRYADQADTTSDPKLTGTSAVIASGSIPTSLLLNVG